MKNLLTALATIAAVACVGSAYAYPTLTIHDGVNPDIVIQDNGVGDGSPLPGVVTFNGMIGIWNINVDTGTTKPAVSGQMDLAFLAGSHSTTLNTGLTLTLTFSDIGFTVLNGLVTDTIGGTVTAHGSITDQILVNGAVVMTLGPFASATSTPFAAQTSQFLTLSPSDVLSLVVIITHPKTGGLSSGDKNLQGLPDGGSALALLGIALTAIEGGRRFLLTRRA